MITPIINYIIKTIQLCGWKRQGNSISKGKSGSYTMNISEKCITIARRYCIENYHYWTEKYTNKRTGTDFPSYSYSKKDYDLFPRYHALRAIQNGVELLVGQVFTDFQQGITALLDASNTETEFTIGPTRRCFTNYYFIFDEEIC